MKFLNKDPLSRIAIKYKIPLGFLTLYLLVFGIVGYFIIHSVYTSLDLEILKRLKNESLAQATIFDKKLETLIRRSEDFASDGFIRTQTSILIASPENSVDEEQGNNLLAETKHILRRHLVENKLPLVDEFLDLQIYSPDGDFILNVLDHEFEPYPLDQSTLHGDGQTFSSIKPPDSFHNFPTAAIITPLRDISRENNIGYLVCILNLVKIIEKTSVEYEDAIAKTTVQKNLTFIDRTGVTLEVPWWFLKERITIEYTHPSDAIQNIKVIPASQSISPEIHNGRHMCQNGKDMFGQSYPMRSTGWVILIELNAHSAMSPIRNMEGTLLGVTLTIASVGLLLLYFPIQFLIRPLGELQKMANRIREGDFTARTEIESDDEIGNLAKTFNLMAAAVNERTLSLQHVAEDLRIREKELRVQHNRLDTVINSMTDGLILINKDNEITLSNQAAEPFLKSFFSSALDHSISKCDKMNREDSDCIHCLLDSNYLSSCICIVDEAITEVIATKFPSAEGRSGKILVVRDITEREQMKERQAHQERLSVLGKTAASLAHEMNNPLAAISLYAQMMEVELPEESSFHEHVSVIKRNTEICRQIIMELLDYAKIPQPQIGEIDLKVILGKAIQMLKPISGKNKIQQFFNVTNSLILGDPAQIRQVFVNIIHNAAQATGEQGGRIVINVTEDLVARTIVTTVEDNGLGIEPKNVSDIFEPFFTTKRKVGTGLGLSIAQRIVNAHNGTLILLSSEPGRTIFQITLPSQLTEVDTG